MGSRSALIMKRFWLQELFETGKPQGLQICNSCSIKQMKRLNPDGLSILCIFSVGFTQF